LIADAATRRAFGYLFDRRSWPEVQISLSHDFAARFAALSLDLDRRSYIHTKFSFASVSPHFGFISIDVCLVWQVKTCIEDATIGIGHYFVIKAERNP
jgi:hypothetical protein